MKKRTFLLNLISFALAFQLTCNAQEKKLRFLNFVNMCPAELECNFQLDEKSIVPGGLKSGAETGWFLMPEKDYDFKVTSPNSEALTETLEEGDKSIFVVYAEESNSEEGGIQYTLKLLRLPTHSPKEQSLRFISLSAAEHEFTISEETIRLEPFEIADSEKAPQKALSISIGDNEIYQVGEQDQVANRFVIIADQDGKPSIVTAVNSDRISFK